MKNWYGFWLLFDDESNQILQRLMRQTKQELQTGPIFIPHTSVYRSVYTDFDAIKELSPAVTKDIDSFEVEVETIDFSDDWSQTLYLKIKSHPNHIEISKRLQNHFEEDYNLFPHVSLVYSNNLTNKQKANCAQNLQLPQKLKVTSLGIINPNSENNDWTDYTKSTVDYSHNL